MNTSILSKLIKCFAILALFGWSHGTAIAACDYEISPTSRNHGFGATTAKVDVVTGSGCNWSVVNTNTWITILSAASGTDDGSVTYAVAGNSNPFSRTGVIRIADQRFTITQVGVICAYEVSPTNKLKCPDSTSGTIGVSTASPCPWTTSNTNDWIIITSGASGTGSGRVFYTVTPNLDPASRTGIVMVAGAVVTIVQQGQPSLVCALDKTVDCGSAWNFDPPASGSNLGDTNFVVQIINTVTNVICGQSFTATRTWEAIDQCGTRLTCSQTVTVLDTTPPVLTCASNKVVECRVTNLLAITGGIGFGGAFVPNNTDLTLATQINSYSEVEVIQVVAGSVLDTFINVGDPVTLAQPFVFSPFSPVNSFWTVGGFTFNFLAFTAPIKADAITLTLKGSGTLSGNGFAETPGLIILTYNSLGMGTLSFSSSTVAMELTNSTSAGTWSFDPPSAWDQCVGTNVTITILNTVTNFTGTCASSYEATRTWMATDLCGNSSTCSQTVTFRDTTPPQITCPPDQTLECVSPWAFAQPTALDLCDGPNVTVGVVSTVTNTLCGKTFRATRTWEAIDQCGNRSTCSQTITVVDTLPPVISCGPAKSVECGPGWSFDQPTAADLCDGTNVAITILSTVTNAAGFCVNSYDVVRTWIAQDACGNSATCSQTVTATDSTPPMIFCAANKSVDCDTPWTFDPPSAFDLCDGINVTLTIVSTVTNATGACTYEAVRIWRATDQCENASTCSQTVTVQNSSPSALIGKLHPPVLQGDGIVRIEMDGDVGGTYIVEASTDLQTWTPVATVQNLSGWLEFFDPASGSGSQRFYRAMMEK